MLQVAPPARSSRKPGGSRQQLHWSWLLAAPRHNRRRQMGSLELAYLSRTRSSRRPKVTNNSSAAVAAGKIAAPRQAAGAAVIAAC
jgi:hypothetical protein